MTGVDAPAPCTPQHVEPDVVAGALAFKAARERKHLADYRSELRKMLTGGEPSLSKLSAAMDSLGIDHGAMEGDLLVLRKHARLRQQLQQLGAGGAADMADIDRQLAEAREQMEAANQKFNALSQRREVARGACNVYADRDMRRLELDHGRLFGPGDAEAAP